MPKLWNETVEEHRQAVRGATLDSAAALVAERGLRAVTMSEVAERTGIGRATLYKYFPDVDAILDAWHERQVAEHLRELTELRQREGDAGARLGTVLEAYALIEHRHRGHEAAALVARAKHVAHAREQLEALVRDLLADAAGSGAVRDDVPPGELGAYCLHALRAAADLPSKAAVRRLVAVVRAGLAP